MKDIQYPPYIAQVLSHGTGVDWMPGKTADEDLAKIVRDALACDDVFVIYSRGDLSPVFEALVARQLGIKPRLTPGGTLNEYKQRLEAKNTPDYERVYQVERLKARCEQALTRDSARKIINEVYPGSIPWISHQAGAELCAIASELLAPASGGERDKNLSRLLRSIYGLPHHPVIYEDNGADVIADTLHRLKTWIQAHNDKYHFNAIETLSNLSGSYDGSEEWFREMSRLRKSLLIALTPTPDPFVTPELCQRMATALSEVARGMKSRVDDANRNKKNIVDAYLKDITQDLLDKYRYPADGTKPFVCNGIVVVDMDACTDMAALQAALSDSRKVIVMGRLRKGQFYEILQGAHGLSLKDGKARVTVYGAQPQPLYCHWLYPNARSVSFRELVRQGLERDFRVGIFSQSSNHAFAREFPDAVKIGNLRDFYHERFDMLFWLADGNEDEGSIAIARAKAQHTMVVVGNPMELPTDSPLQDFYHRSAGDELYGKVFH